MKPATFFYLLIPAVLGLGYWGLRQEALGSSVDYNSQIKPLLNKHCITCHGGVKRQGGFSLLFRSDALAKTESGKPAIIPFHPEQSDFIKRLSLTDPEERMPYKHDPLKKEEIALLTRWVKEGAIWGDHWAYKAPLAPTIDKPMFASLWNLGRWEKNDIDYLVKKQLDQVGLKHAQEADKITLLRRVCFDLTGLPPTPAQVQQLLADDSEENYEKIIDELLKSPAFGERWATIWLDLARYSDSRGYQKDNGRTIWEYRDWVIKAFNNDMPYDQFTIEQLAGDLLPNPTDNQLIATAFHRNTMNNDETGTVDEEYRVAAILDRVNTTWEVFQSTTFACVQCHSHPYDPFRNEEYYNFYAFFNNTRDEDTQDEAPFLRKFKPQDQAKFDSLQTWLKARTSPQKVKEITHFIRTLEPRLHAHYADSYQKGALLGDRQIGVFKGGSCRLPSIEMTGKTQFLMSYNNKFAGGTLQIRLDKPTGEVIGQLRLDTASKKSFLKYITLKPQKGRHDLYLTGTNPKLEEEKEIFRITWFTLLDDFPQKNTPEAQKYQAQFDQLIEAKTDNTPIMIASNPDYARKTYTFVRGNWLVHGKEVQPDVPRSMPTMPKDLPRNRLGLAKWLVSKQNPLTARAMVNRLWEQLFGYGLVETLEDFGTQGAKPTQQKLLDYLAVKYQNEFNWSTKKLLKYIVLSATYRQDSQISKAAYEQDPSNKWLARGPRLRLTAEQIHDQALAISGLLSRKMYGKPTMPYQPEGIWQAVNSNLQWKQSEGEDLHRRSIYTFARRTGPYPATVIFDGGSRELCLSRRIRTNTPLQALVLLNDPVYLEAAKTMALKVMKQTQSPDKQIENLYQQITFKEISTKKSTALISLYQKVLAEFQHNSTKISQFLKTKASPQTAALVVVTNTMLNLDEVVVKM